MGGAEGIAILHVLISYRGARRASESVERTAEQARLLAEHLLTRARAHEPMSELAAAWSDEPYGRRHAGFVQLPGDCTFPAFSPAFALEPGAFAEVVESDYGFHVLQRIR